jgi:hypothetical protein
MNKRASSCATSEIRHVATSLGLVEQPSVVEARGRGTLAHFSIGCIESPMVRE